MYKISAIYSVNGSQESRENEIFSARAISIVNGLNNLHKKCPRFSVTCIVYRRKLPDITQVLNVYVIRIKFLQNTSFLRKLNPLNFTLTY